MPSGAKCLLVEDHLTHELLARAKLKAGGHTVVARAASLEAALELVQQPEFLEVEVAILDGNLTPRDESGKDGERIAEAIRAKGFAIPIVCLSSAMKGYRWADHSLFKHDVSGSRENILADLVSRL